MPQGDRTGPNGQGPMTGRGRGYCVGSNMPGSSFSCRGFGRGRGFAWRARAMPVQPVVMTEEQEKKVLNQELENLKQETKEIEERLKELK
jgi:hypothetical protein